MGVHYTPPALAGFVAERLVSHIPKDRAGPLRILDPACGDGILLEALLKSVQEAGKSRECAVVGVEADRAAAQQAEARCAAFAGVRLRFVQGDFLDRVGGQGEQATFWGSPPPDPGFTGSFDLVIANPPYVRTQVLGAEKSQRLAVRYGLTGRVDLYHAFLVATTRALKPGGWVGMITSNRFLTTRGGTTIRGYLASNYDIHEVIDLGDTKLFEAAVLPAVLVARRRRQVSRTQSLATPRFIKVYSQPSPSAGQLSGTGPQTDVVQLLRKAEPGVYRTPTGMYRLTAGDLVLGEDPSQVWSLLTCEEAAWLTGIRSAAQGCFNDVATVHVGIKTTADSVFIRTDWDTLPDRIRPESELLHPLLQHEDARRWSLNRAARPAGRILYPHEVRRGHRCAVDLARYPRAKAYLESYRERLQKRHYVIDAGRQWYEIWVPQDPNGWAGPKVVFPDISPEPRFYLDNTGSLVGGDCYWITLRPGVPAKTIFLVLAVANSSLATRFHDLAFNNKLYSARRRYITQYVAQYPLPDCRSKPSRTIMELAAPICEETLSKSQWEEHCLSAEVDRLVYAAFGAQQLGDEG